MEYLILICLLLTACGQNVFIPVKGDKGDPGESVVGQQGERGIPGPNGLPGKTGDGVGIITNYNAASCSGLGGTVITTFEDPSNTGLFKEGDVILSIATICNGERGEQGQRGDRGISGRDGIDATPITPVQLCPNSGPTVYPTHFPEQALCVSGQLYGIYNDGVHPLAFLALLPTGLYASVATGATCTLLIKDNCEVEQQ